MIQELMASISLPLSTRNGLMSQNSLAVRSPLTTSILLIVILDSFMPRRCQKRRLKAYHLRKLLNAFWANTIAMFSLATFQTLQQAPSILTLRLQACFSCRNPSRRSRCLTNPHTFLMSYTATYKSRCKCLLMLISIIGLFRVCLMAWKGDLSWLRMRERSSSYMASCGSSKVGDGLGREVREWQCSSVVPWPTRFFLMTSNYSLTEDRSCRLINKTYTGPLVGQTTIRHHPSSILANKPHLSQTTVQIRYMIPVYMFALKFLPPNSSIQSQWQPSNSCSDWAR